VLRVAALLALLPAHYAVPVRLDVTPRAFSPYAAPLTVSANLPGPVKAGIRLVRPGGRTVGWVLPPRRRASVALAWHGRLRGRLLPDGHYQLQLVAGKRVLGRATFRLDATAPRLTDFRAPTAADRSPATARC
jgi:hypothetical protein